MGKDIHYFLKKINKNSCNLCFSHNQTACRYALCVTQDEADFRYLDVEPRLDSKTLMAEKLLRTAQLEEMLTEGEKSHSPTEGSWLY